MINHKAIQLSKTRTILAGLLVLLLLAVAPLATALESPSFGISGQDERFGPPPSSLPEMGQSPLLGSPAWIVDCGPVPLPVVGDPSPADGYDPVGDGEPVVLPDDLICDPAAGGN
jgi:hypothetical protein